MIYEKHKKGWMCFLDHYSWWLMQRHFRSIRFVGDLQNRGLPSLIIGNHFSWYDGFIQHHLNKKYLGKKFHVMMLEEQLSRYTFLQNVGAFSVKKSSRDIIRSLNHAADILSHPENMLILFPQGEIQTLYTQPFQFQKGIDFILKKTDNLQIIFNVNLVDYFSFKKPELSIYFKEYEGPSAPLIDLQSAFNDFAAACRKQQVEE